MSDKQKTEHLEALRSLSEGRCPKCGTQLNGEQCGDCGESYPVGGGQ